MGDIQNVYAAGDVCHIINDEEKYPFFLQMRLWTQVYIIIIIIIVFIRLGVWVLKLPNK